MIVMKDPAMIKFSLLPSSETKFANPTDIGNHSLVLVTNNGQASAFQEPMKESTVMTMIGAVESGITIMVSIRK